MGYGVDVEFGAGGHRVGTGVQLCMHTITPIIETSPISIIRKSKNPRGVALMQGTAGQHMKRRI